MPPWRANSTHGESAFVAIEPGRCARWPPRFEKCEGAKSITNLGFRAWRAPSRKSGAAGYLSAGAMMTELNARGVSNCRGGRWTTQTLRRALGEMRRCKIDYEPTDDVLLAARRAAKDNGPEWSKGKLADWLPSLAPILTEVRAVGHLSTAAMVRELNARGLRACHGGPWTMQRLRVALRVMRKYKIDYEPKADAALATPLDEAKAKKPKRSKVRQSIKSTASRVARRPSKSKRLSRGNRRHR